METLEEISVTKSKLELASPVIRAHGESSPQRELKGGDGRGTVGEISMLKRGCSRSSMDWGRSRRYIEEDACSTGDVLKPPVKPSIVNWKPVNRILKYILLRPSAI